MRSDVNYNVEVYYVQNYIDTLQEIQVSFIIDVFTMTENKELLTSMFANVEQMVTSKSNNNKRFKGV